MVKKFETGLKNEFHNRLGKLKNIVYSRGSYVATEELNGYAVWCLAYGYNILRMYPFVNPNSKDAAFNNAKRHIENANH